MGLHDTEDQLDACRTQSVIDEATIAELREALATQTDTAMRLRDKLDNLGAIADTLAAQVEGLARQNAELEHDLARAESALADRLQHDAHAHRIGERVDGILLTSEEAALTVRACRHSAESIRAVLDVDPTRLHPDVAGYVQRLQDLADRLQAAAA